MIIKWVNQILLIIVLGCVVFLWIQQKRVNRIAFIRSAVVLDKYKAMDEAKDLYQKKVEQWKVNYDSLEFNYNKSLQKFNASSGLSKKEMDNYSENLKRQEDIAEKYAKTIEEKANQENEKLTQGVLNQVNDFVKSYAKQNGYDIVLGVTLSGNILYGSDAMDITDKIIDGLNKEFAGKKK